MTNAPLKPDALEAMSRVMNPPAWDMIDREPEDELVIMIKKAELGRAERLVGAYLAAAQPEVRGYIIVDKKTNAIDWDGELHTSIESAIESMTGPHQSMCRTAEEEDDAANDGRTAWWRIYSIHTVTDGPEVNDV